MSDTPKPLMELDDLLTRAMARQTPHKPRRKAGDTIDPKELALAEKRIRERFTDPNNWTRSRNVALIHEETDTLLGNFVEYTHKLSVGVCRRLVRVSEPAPVQDVERVAGPNWIAQPLAGKPDEVPAEEQREAICDLHLPEMDHVFAPAVMVQVTLRWGGIARVELCEETRFFNKDRKVQLILPEGLDVLEGMSLDSKLALRKWLGL